ncbi:hypothetical protein [Burkholderia gladioli]|uniref:hypothetical protein n=1 Tax=Burkholderia gladioli TaxID=28095 RepID=UPI0016422BE8|nr:hypothetical protein [Burkholderia gladioli]
MSKVEMLAAISGACFNFGGLIGSCSENNFMILAATFFATAVFVFIAMLIEAGKGDTR